MKQIEQSYSIKAPLDKVWQALTTAELAEQWGAGPAVFESWQGGKFSYWDGDIHGINTKVVENQLLEQDWYGHDNPELKYIAKFTLTYSNDTTIVRLEFSGDIKDEKKDINDWQEYYFTPIRKLLET